MEHDIRRLEELRAARREARDALGIIAEAVKDGMTWAQIGRGHGRHRPGRRADVPADALSVLLIITGDRLDAAGHEAGAELWREPFAGWGELHELLHRQPVHAAPLRRSRGKALKVMRSTILRAEPWGRLSQHDQNGERRAVR